MKRFSEINEKITYVPEFAYFGQGKCPIAFLLKQLNQLIDSDLLEASFKDFSKDHLDNSDHASPTDVALIIDFSITHPYCVDKSFLKLHSSLI